MKWIILAFTVSATLYGGYEENRILFLANQGQLPQAIELYETLKEEKGQHQLELLQQMALLVLDKGSKVKESETQLLAIFGAGISMNENALYILEEGMRSSNPQIQAVALNFLAKSQQDIAHSWLIRSLSSPYPIIRLEAAYQLALQKHPTATEQIEALMYKLDPRAAVLFPQLFALAGDHGSLKMLKKLLTHSSIDVRVSAIVSASQAGRDDLLPLIKKIAAQHEPKQQEAAAYALGVFKDHSSQALLQQLAKSSHTFVQIAAWTALSELENKEALAALKEWALKKDLFAIRALGAIQGSEDLLYELTQNRDMHVRLNASLSLLERKDSRALRGIAEILLRDSRDTLFAETSSPGRSMKVWRAISAASVEGQEEELLNELSLSFKEDLLRASTQLPEKDFLELTAFLFEKKRNDLIPYLTALLIELDSKEAIALLKREQQKAGAPLIRNYANLALVKLNEEGAYREKLIQWLNQQVGIDMMKFRAYVPYDKREAFTTFELTPQESARLLIDSLEYLSLNQDEQGIELILSLLKDGHPNNRYVAAGLLLRATQ